MNAIVTRTCVLSLALLTGLLAAQPGLAAEQAANSTQAQKMVKENGYIIFAYADGWDDYSQARCEALMKNGAIRKAAGDAVLMPLPIPERPDEARRRKQDELRGGLNIPGCMSYPALIFLDKEGEHYASLEGRAVARGSEAELAALIEKRVAAGQERARLIAASADATLDGPARARRLFEAYQLEGLTWGGRNLAARLEELDPEDVSGVVRAQRFDAYGFSAKVSAMSVAEGVAEVDKMLADPAYTARQKQLMCAAALGMLRRRGGLAEAEGMRRYAVRMQELVPDSPEGRAAAKILRDWIPGLRYGRGWSPGCIPTSPTPLEMGGELPIREAGEYEVTFQYTRGRMALVVHAVTLCDGACKVAEDVHRGVAGHQPWKNVFILSVPAEVKEPHLFITLGQGDRDSHGNISIRKR